MSTISKPINEMIQRFADFCGEEAYRKFVTVLKSSAKRNGRLMQWQENALERFRDATGHAIPTNYRDLIRLYSSPDRHVSLNVRRDKPSELYFDKPVVRKFSSLNQFASGGSHITAFTVRLSTERSESNAVIRDECSPDEHPEALQELLEELASGVESFLTEKAAQNINIHSLCIALLEYSFHETDWKPRKHRLAINFVLEDLFCELRCNRLVQTKLLGIPL